MAAFAMTHDQARELAREQLGMSLCGATAVLSVIRQLGLPVVADDIAVAAVKSRLRAEQSDAATYLVSRSVAGCRACDIADALHALYGSRIQVTFLGVPDVPAAVGPWLASHLVQSRTCAAIATLNPQRTYAHADAWHHQQVYGVDCSHVFLTNPIEAMPIEQFAHEASSPSVLLVRLRDLVRRLPASEQQAWGEAAVVREALRQAHAASDGPTPGWAEWEQLGVATQIADALAGRSSAAVVAIPAAYRAGVTFVVRSTDEGAPLEL